MNENPEGLPKEFFNEVMQTITPEYIATYPETGKLKSLLADDLGVSKEQILLTNGSDDGLKTIFEVFGDYGKKMVSVWPSFAMYMVYAKMNGMIHVEVPYNDDFSVDVDCIINSIDSETSIVSLLNPNNPIGNVYTDDEVIRIIRRSKEMGAIVIIDEAYHYFYSKTFIEICKKYDNVILTRTFSKLCSIAGLRIGYLVSTPEIIKTLYNSKPTYAVNCIALRFAENIISNKTLINQMIETEAEGRKYIIDLLKENNIHYYAQNGNYVFIGCKGCVEETVKKLAENGVLVKSYGNQPLLKDYIRISTGSKAIMDKFWKIFVKVRGI